MDGFLVTASPAGLTDGAGVFPYVKSALFLYLSRTLGLTFDRTGFRLPGDDIPESETGNPFAGLDIDGAEEPLFTKETTPDFLRLNDGAEFDPQVTDVKLSEAQPENSLWAMKQRKATYAKLGQMPLKTKVEDLAKSAGSMRWSIAVSYTNCRSFGPLDPYIEELYALAEPGVASVICEITCINRCFFLSIGQAFPSDAFVAAFLDELSSVGIDYEVMRKEPFHLCGMERFEAAEPKSGVG